MPTTHGDTSHFARKHAPDATVNEEVREALLKRATEGKLPCVVAFDIAKEHDVAPDMVGRTADLMEVRLIRCQLGLFGYHPKKGIVRPAAVVTAALEKAIRDGLVNQRLPCISAWKIAEEFGIHKMQVSSACDALGIKIRPCQLGAF